MCIRDRSGLGGRAVGLARQLHPAGKALEHVVVPGLLLPRAGHAESGQRDTDDRRVEMLEVIVSDADLRRHVASQVRVDDVGDLDEFLEDRTTRLSRQIEREAALVAVEGLEAVSY